MHYFIGNLGHLFVITAFVTSLATAFSYYRASTANDQLGQDWLKTGRVAFWIHSISVVGVVVVLYTIIRGHYFEYHYAWSHSSRRLPTHYMISCFWEGQEGSFLLWLFWHAILGIIIIISSTIMHGRILQEGCQRII